MDDPLVTDDARGLVADLAAHGHGVATAESLTAGLLAATLAGVPGASAVLRGGLVTYTVETKIALAAVPREVLDAVGPVAAQTARALAVGARRRCAATWGVGLTGVAGPEPHGGHPVGTVFVGLAGPRGGGPDGDAVDAELGADGEYADGQYVEVVELHLTGSRWDIRAGAVAEAIARLRVRVREFAADMPRGGNHHAGG